MRILNAVVVTAVVIMLAGCASGAAAVKTIDPSPEQSTTPQAAPVSAPTSRLGLTCANLVPSTLVDSLLDMATAITDLSARPQNASPLGYAVSQLGGSSCLASGPANLQSFISVQVLPQAAKQWATFAEKTPEVVSGGGSKYGDAASVLCFNVDEKGSCSVNILEGDSWIEVVARGITASTLSNEAVAELAAPLITEIVGTVGSAPSPSAVWVAPSSTGVLPEDCSTYATAGEFQALFATAEDLVMGSGNDGEAWGIDNASWTMAEVHRCAWAAANTGQTWPLYVTSLPGGEWAYERSAGVMTGEGSSQRVADTIAGGDAATFGCHVYSGFCSLGA